MNRKIFLGIMAVLIIFIIFDPFQSICNSGSEVRKYYVDNKTVNNLAEHISEDYKSPIDYTTSLFTSKTIVMIGEFRYISQQVRFIQDLIPALYENGIYNLGIEYALVNDQDKIDGLLTEDEYKPEIAHNIMFNYMSIWGYKEYADIFKTAWELNNSLPDGANPFRIIALSPKQEYQHFINEKDAEDAETLHKVFANGIPDEIMAKTVIEKIIEKGEKAVLYTSYERSFTKYISTKYANKMQEKGFNETRRMGNIIYERIGDKAWSVFLHGPIPDSAAKFGLSYPANGTMSSVIKKLPEGKKAAGFDLRDKEWGSITMYNPRLTEGYDDLILQDVWDGYISLGYHIDQYTGATAIENFITENNIEEAVRNFPGPTPENVTPKDLNEYIAGITANTKQIFEKF
jgi:hypothetical protein